ncbi:MAG: hypothetical protein HY060_11470 [Proteobacteria bacterium]|nr:hypothetical protein [Pseudomonadota bacterium]
MERLRYFADLSIRRGCAFGILTIATAMTGMSHDMRLAVRGGALMLTLMVVVLVWKSWRAGQVRYRRTELWVLLDRQLEWPESYRQQLISGVLAERYMWHARVTAMAAFALWVIALAMMALRA